MFNKQYTAIIICVLHTNFYRRGLQASVTIHLGFPGHVLIFSPVRASRRVFWTSGICPGFAHCNSPI